MDKIFKLLETVVADVIPVSNARIAAALVIRNDIISIGINKKKSHPFQAKFLKNDHAIFLHAEIDAIKNALKKYDISKVEKSTLYICRMKWSNGRKKFERGLAKPCSGCMMAISTFNINNVYYTTNGPDIKKL
jgi:tRNA(Arg) A34 adenosine deaminase TadA